MTASTAPHRQAIPPRDIRAADRNRGEPSAAGEELPHLRRPLIVIAAVVLALLAAGSLVRVALRAYYQHLTLTGLTADTTPIALTIGGEKLTIPANMLRFAAGRRGGTAERADLVLLWPTLEGYSQHHADAFADSAPAAPLIYATVTGRPGGLDSTGRLDEVYDRFFTGKPVPGPNGLVGRHLSADSGYGNEIVFYAPGDSRPFVARCPADAAPDIPATCIRDINFGRGLSLLYRFDRTLLEWWPALDRDMMALATGFVGG